MATRIHLIANSHIDPVWLWDRYEGIDEVLNTFRSACDRLDEYPGLCFTASSLQFYAWVQRYDGGLFRRIQEKVAAGRWEITGGWWVEPDTNLPTAESFLQHRRQSQAFTDEHFPGVEVDVAYVPDSFGHPATLPKLLVETRFKYFVFCRPGAHEKPDLPANLFWWECEGHRVLAYRVKHHYLQPHPDGGEKDEELRRRLGDPEYAEGTVNAFFFGLGDHGGGPTKREIDFYCRYLAEQPEGEFVFSTCQAFFREAAQLPDIPTYSGDLHMHAVGCYSVVRDLKDGVRRAERGLAFAARARALSSEGGGRATSPPELSGTRRWGADAGGRGGDDLDPLWQRTLFNQFHDILPGSCSPAAADMARAELGGVEAGWRDAAYEACKQVAAARPVRAPEGEFRIFNTLDRQVRVPLRIESFQYFREGAAFCDEDGREVAVQEVLPSVRCNNRRWEFVDVLPARSFRSYHFDSERAAELSSARAPHFAAGDAVQAGRFRVDGGGIQGPDGAVLMAAPRLLVLDDASDTWGHGVRIYDDVTGAFELAHSAAAGGPVVQCLYQRWTYGCSTAEVIWSVYAGLDEVCAEVTINWAEDRKILKWELTPAGCGADEYWMEGPGGGIRRTRSGEEMPLHSWVQLAAGDRAFSLLQDGAFACDCKGERLRVNLVRSSLYGYHDPVQLVAEDPQHLTDQGIHQFRFRFRFGAAHEPDELSQAAEEFLEPYWVIREGPGSRA